MTKTQRSRRSTAVALYLVVAFSAPAAATHPCSSPLILDLDNDGVRTTSLFLSVNFDINGDGAQEEIGWTYPESQEAFLVLDLNHNGMIDGGQELFGNATFLPSGQVAENGFQALSSYDTPALGGNADGAITHADGVWNDLRLWLDENQDGVSQHRELQTLGRHKVLGIYLSYEQVDEFDGNMNLHAQRGYFLKRVRLLGQQVVRAQIVDDVYFVVREEEP